MKKFNGKILLSLILAVIGFFIIIFFCFTKAFNDGSGIIDAGTAGDYGGFIGGLVGPIFSLSGILLLYETIVAQRLSFENQQKAFEIQQFETKFFELVRFHRDNVSQMIHRVPWDDNNYYDKARVFIEMRSQFSKIFKIVKSHVDKFSKIKEVDKEKSVIVISYLILFFGVSKATRPDLEHSLLRYGFEKTLTSEIINELYLFKARYNNKTVYYGGHQVRLGHYFRHLFQSVKFVDNAAFLSSKQKYEYVKILRAQLTQYELGIFFLNSLSIGQEWNNKNYITNYKMIKNLPKNFISEINPKNYYGTFKYEWEK